MLYWIIMAALILVALVLIAAIVICLKKGTRRQADYEDEYDDYGDEDEYGDESEEEPYPEPVRMRRRNSRDTEPVNVQEPEPPRKSARKQWRVLLENLETWEKFSYTFYDDIGIGRSRNDAQFEKFLVVREDPRVSKVHCAIMRKDDKLYLKDMGSRNGTFLNGHRIQHPVVIQRDDVIGIGETRIEVKKVLRER